MLVLADEDFHHAASRLDAAGFKKTPWSFGTRRPTPIAGDEISERIHSQAIQTYRKLNENSVRYVFPYSSFQGAETIVLIRSSYAHISPPVDEKSSSSQSRFIGVQGNLYWPDAKSLLTSIIQTLLEEDGGGLWRLTLEAWAVAYLWGLQTVSADVLDQCPDQTVRQWLDETTNRNEGGLDQGPTKRKKPAQEVRSPLAHGTPPPPASLVERV